MPRKIQARNVEQGDKIMIEDRWVTVGTINTFTVINYSYEDDEFPGVIHQDQIEVAPTRQLRTERS